MCPCNFTSHLSVFACWEVGSKNNFKKCLIWKAAQSTWHLWALTCHTVAVLCACSIFELHVSFLPLSTPLNNPLPTPSSALHPVSSPAALLFGIRSRTEDYTVYSLWALSFQGVLGVASPQQWTELDISGTIFLKSLMKQWPLRRGLKWRWGFPELKRRIRIVSADYIWSLMFTAQ